ncbi:MULTISPECIES: large-conductance mechanosensitive channel protein MscL [Lactobacillus]|jgi:large conductance mechanosensitive channel|uniref:Large-conductance mechanosensitive channel n=1 Tax=Lactobacillus bombicola TaxID=1505723 RepID=A0A396SZY0_9LACO|nr:MULTISPECIES: large-conductance mechanosensitive channel protein MscL [Lactobacillus]RHW49288.1 large conductance mechanosensitive channel protein MscL [Lactobacillus bombicola]RHW52475.1 large conductance mechanosensitive channel protein MscL [Lactobacillus bombicola]RHW53900.1 large conductance mechanosensitive channel protein MscL [Lactobacillus bombicola]RMC41300.1 large-conductance mechanosensitive channel protein MscL [Lactobacillus sp. ESL0237]RMC45169.1 large-conductance mechanosens
MLKEFKKFIERGNVIDLAVGVIIGGAFTNIVNSLVTNLINPLIGLFIGKIDLSNLVLKVSGATFRYGEFINTVINFLIIAFIVFLLVKAVNKVTKHDEQQQQPAGPSTEDYLKQIRDLLKEKSN